MFRKVLILSAAGALAVAVAVVAAGDVSLAKACKKSGATASASGCQKTSATAASATCSRTAATTASSSCCKSGKAAVAGYTKSAESCDKSNAQALKGIVTDIPYMENKRMVVAGSLSCGSCEYHATASCAPLLKTADGKVYPLLPNHLVENMMAQKNADGYEVASSVRTLSGVKYLEVKAFKSL